MTELSAWFAFFPPFPTGELFKQLLAAGVGTAAFSVLFYVPRKYYGFCAACGAWGWLTYFVLEWAGMTVTEATFFAAAAVVFLSRLFAVMERCPATLFMIPGIFPLVPGAGIYWTAYYIVTDQMELASRTAFQPSRRRWPSFWGSFLCLRSLRSFLNGSWEKNGRGKPPGTSKMRRERKRIQVFTDFSQYAIILRVCILRIRKGWFYNGNFT